MAALKRPSQLLLSRKVACFRQQNVPGPQENLDSDYCKKYFINFHPAFQRGAVFFGLLSAEQNAGLKTRYAGRLQRDEKIADFGAFQKGIIICSI